MVESNITLGRWEAITLLVNLMSVQIVLGFPRLMAEAAGTAGWLLPIYLSIFAFLGFYIITKLYSRFEGKDLLDISEYIGGNIVRIIVGLIILGFLLFANAVILREFAEDMKVIALTTSPISFVSMFFIIGMVVGAYIGLEAIVRFHAIVVPILIVGFFFILFAVAPYYNFNNIFPILGTGAYDVFGRSLSKLSIFAALVALYIITPYIKTNKNFKFVGYTTIGIGTFFFFTGVLAYLLVYPYPVALENFLPMYQLARLINFGRFFQRVESIFMLLWGAAALLYLSTAFFLGLHIFRKTFKLEYYKPLILPFAILVFSLSLLAPNLVTAIELETKYFRNFAWIITFLLPMILLLIARFMQKGAKKGGAKG